MLKFSRLSDFNIISSYLDTSTNFRAEYFYSTYNVDFEGVLKRFYDLVFDNRLQNLKRRCFLLNAAVFQKQARRHEKQRFELLSDYITNRSPKRNTTILKKLSFSKYILP